jgi:hypothetical protein
LTAKAPYAVTAATLIGNDEERPLSTVYLAKDTADLVAVTREKLLGLSKSSVAYGFVTT